MDNSTWTIFFLLIVFVFFIVLFAVVDYVTKGKKKAKPTPATVKYENVVSPKNDISEPPARIDASSDFFNEITALIPLQEQKNEEKSEAASQRSRMHNRRARMSEYRQKYLSRTVDFDSENYDKPLSSQPSSFLVEGIEISQDDVRKLTALHGLFTRKTDTE